MKYFLISKIVLPTLLNIAVLNFLKISVFMVYIFPFMTEAMDLLVSPSALTLPGTAKAFC